MKFGYCTNVHAGTTLDLVKQNLRTYSVPIRDQLNVDQLPVGLWLSDPVSRELKTERAIFEFGQWLQEHRLLPYTFNGFPFSDFHQAVVKHRVYGPTWADPDRLEYTLRLARIMAGLIPAGQCGTISTLPIGWPLAEKNRHGSTLESRWQSADVDVINRACENFLQLVSGLEELERETERHVQVCIEPEPGCLLDCWQDVVCLFESRLFAGDQIQRERVQRYLGICHDICHSAVMFEPQAEALQRYVDKGISVGKIQVSSAVEAVFGVDTEEVQHLLQALRTFSEPRYLHQTSISNSGSQLESFYEDLGLALNENVGDQSPLPAVQTWRVHFHVPIFLARLQRLTTTQSEIVNCLAAVDRLGIEAQLEVETYAWNVLPRCQERGSEHGDAGLIAGIARELEWLREAVE